MCSPIAHCPSASWQAVALLSPAAAKSRAVLTSLVVLPAGFSRGGDGSAKWGRRRGGGEGPLNTSNSFPQSQNPAVPQTGVVHSAMPGDEWPAGSRVWVRVGPCCFRPGVVTSAAAGGGSGAASSSDGLVYVQMEQEEGHTPLDLLTAPSARTFEGGIRRYRFEGEEPRTASDRPAARSGFFQAQDLFLRPSRAEEEV